MRRIPNELKIPFIQMENEKHSSLNKPYSVYNRIKNKHENLSRGKLTREKNKHIRAYLDKSLTRETLYQ